MKRHRSERAKRWRKRQFRLCPVQVCYYCRRQVTQGSATTDHIIPLSRGGLDQPTNFVIACLRCNHKKRDKVNEHKKM